MLLVALKNEADKTFIQGLIPDIIDNGNIQITEQNFDLQRSIIKKKLSNQEVY